MKHRLSSTFGRDRVSQQQREALVRSVFDRVAGRYDLMNDLMSFGIHRLWKWRFCRLAQQLPGGYIVDLAGGTGDIASRLIDGRSHVHLIDPSQAMMQIARQRLGRRCQYTAASAENLPLVDASIDAVTISFGIRNTTDIVQSLHEICRVLKPGGRFFCLEFSTPAAWLRPFYGAWSRFVIPRLGAWVAGHPDAYTYLIDSIREFPAQREMVELIAGAGFEEVGYRNLSFGIACIHWGRKPVSVES